MYVHTCVRACVCFLSLDVLSDLEQERNVTPPAPAALPSSPLHLPCALPRAPVCSSPQSQPLPCVLLASSLSPAFWIIFVAGLIFLFIHCWVTRSLNFCLNFVCLSFSLLACSLSVHAVVLSSLLIPLLPLVSIRCKLRTCGECLPRRAPSPCEYKAGQFLLFLFPPRLPASVS